MNTRNLLVALIPALCCIVPCQSHGHMTLPPSRNGGTFEKAGDCLHGECMWFSQPDADYVHKIDRTARISGEPTLNTPPLRTYNVNVTGGPLDYTRTSPWRAPGPSTENAPSFRLCLTLYSQGSAPVFGSGCGMAGGGPLRQSDGGTALEFGLKQNMDGSELPQVESANTTWSRGTVQEVAWANNANHGGG